jgi:hypothetical protein
VAIALSGASNARVDFGDIAAIGGLAAISVAFTFKPTTAVSGTERLITQWGSPASTDAALLIATTDTDELAIIVGGAAGLYGKKTTDVNLTSGTLYRIVMRLTISSGGVHAGAGSIWVNGVSRTIAAVFSDAVITIRNAGTSFQIGHETDEAIDGEDGEYSEVAVWGESVPDWVCEAYGIGASPRVYRQNGILYGPLWNTTHIWDEWGGAVGTNSSGTDADHPTMTYPRSPLMVTVGA